MSTKSSNPSQHRFAVLATDIVCFRLIDGRLSVLLGKIENVPEYKGMWGVIGGMIVPDETAEQSVERHLKGKAGIKHIFKEQLYTFSSINRDPRGRVVSVAYLALAGSNPQEGEGKLETKWQPVDALPKLAYDHGEIVEYAIERLRGKIEYTDIARHIMPAEFTLSELQHAYEVILGRELDKRNFRKKMLADDVLKDTGHTRKLGVMRPAALYAFTSHKKKSS